LDINDYRNGFRHVDGPGQHILVIGNRFEHKRILATSSALSGAFVNEKIVVLGFQHDGGPNVVSFHSGSLSELEMHQLLAGAKFVVFPSTYEGFGFPILESLALRKPVLARSIPVIQTIREKIHGEANLLLYSSTSELIERLKKGFPEWRDNGGDERGDPSGSWDATSLRIGQFITEAIASFDLEKVLLPRIRHMHILGQFAEQSGGPTFSLRGSDELASALEDREAQIEDLHKSWSWRLTSPIRKIASVYLNRTKPK
jgi:Glycosyl transferases group 1